MSKPDPALVKAIEAVLMTHAAHASPVHVGEIRSIVGAPDGMLFRLAFQAARDNLRRSGAAEFVRCRTGVYKVANTAQTLDKSSRFERKARRGLERATLALTTISTADASDCERRAVESSMLRRGALLAFVRSRGG